MGLDFIPSSDPEHPGLLIRDPLKFSDAMLLIPPQLVECLACFDGEQTSLDLRANLVRITGEIQIGELEKHLFDTLSQAGFLEDEAFEAQRWPRVSEFAAAPKRDASHAGSAYPDNADEARKSISEFMQGARLQMAGGFTHWYRRAARQPFWRLGILPRRLFRACFLRIQDRTFVVLGTSHYGEPDRFGLTRKPFVTPFGETITDRRLVDELAEAAPGSIRMEDYCHAIEHSIEFQVLFLQYLYGPNIRILPILCGSFLRSIYQGGKPEGNENVQRFFDSLGNISAREGNKLFWVLGVDMAHMGRRYGDQMIARADGGEMAAVAERDKRRIERLTAADAAGFWELIQQNQDDLKWCGSAPMYTFPESGAASSRDVEALPAVEHRRAKRG